VLGPEVAAEGFEWNKEPLARRRPPTPPPLHSQHTEEGGAQRRRIQACGRGLSRILFKQNPAGALEQAETEHGSEAGEAETGGSIQWGCWLTSDWLADSASL